MLPPDQNLHPSCSAFSWYRVWSRPRPPAARRSWSRLLMRTDAHVRRSSIWILALLLAIGLPARAAAQALADPAWAEFTPSPDHNASTGDGTPIVTNYELDFYMIGAASPFTSRNLEKPSPAGDGLIHVSLTSLFGGLPAGVIYEARVKAVGPGGATASTPSNQFTYTSTPCSYAVSADSSSFDATGGSSRVGVTTGSNCNWVASVDVPWIILEAPSAGTSSGAVSFRVSANQGTGNRTGTISVQGQTIIITQAGTSPCFFNVTLASATFPAAGGSGLMTVDSGTVCTWTVASQASWITLGRTSGSAHADVAFAVAANTSSAPRVGRVTVNDKTIEISQEGNGSTCTIGLNPTAQTFGSTGGPGSAAVTAASSCSWMARTDATWIRLASQLSMRTGSGPVDYTIDANTATTPRTGTVTVEGTTLTITQAGATSTSCYYWVTDTTTSFPAAGGTGSSTVDAGQGCTWTATSPVSWIRIDAGSGSGFGRVSFTVQPNSGSAREAMLAIADRSIRVTQSGATTGCTFGLNPTAQSFTASGGSGTTALTSSTSTCMWNASTDASWITLSSATSGTGPSTVSYRVAAHTGTSPRSGNILVGGVPLVINQSAATTSCTVSVAPKAVGVGGSRSQTSVAVSAGPGCGWTAQSQVGWATIISGATGTGNGVVTLRIARNPTTQARSGVLIVGGQPVSITQSGSSGGGPKSPDGFRVLEAR